MLRCSLTHPEDYSQGWQPTRWYPGWKMFPQRESQGGTAPEPPHHTFEVRRQGAVPVTTGLLGIVLEATLLARNPRARRNLETLARSAVWEHGRQLHRVDRSRVKVSRKAQELVARYLREEAIS